MKSTNSEINSYSLHLINILKAFKIDFKDFRRNLKDFAVDNMQKTGLNISVDIFSVCYDTTDISKMDDILIFKYINIWQKKWYYVNAWIHYTKLYCAVTDTVRFCWIIYHVCVSLSNHNHAKPKQL